jgi:protein pelota
MEKFLFNVEDREAKIEACIKQGIVMKIIKEIPEKNIIKVMPENLDDLWHLSNIIEKNNAVSAMTERRIEEKGDKLRADRGAKRRVYLGVKVEKVNFHEDTNRLRVSGKIIHGPDDVPLGAYQKRR